MHASNRGILTVITLVVLIILTGNPVLAENPASPIVYSDDYISVRSSIVGAEEETFHLGDVIYIAISSEFDTTRVRVLNMDETLLNDSWPDSPWIVPRGLPEVMRTTDDGRTRVSALYPFQVIACPDGEERCPGGKLYSLDDIALGIELRNDDGRVVSNTDIMFRPSPGFVSLASALTVINGRVESFNFYFPRRAFGSPVSVEIDGTSSLWLFLAGLILVSGMVVAPTARDWLRHRVPAGAAILGNRWERVLDRLEDEGMNYLEFCEGVRVAVTWYCHDEYQLNTLDWNMSDRDMSGDDELVTLHSIYQQVITSPDLDEKARTSIIQKLTGIMKS